MCWYVKEVGQSKNHLSSELWKSYFENFNNAKTNHTIQKRAKDLNKHFAQEDTQITNKYMKRCSPSPVNGKRQSKSTMSYRLGPRRLATLKKTDKNKYWWGLRQAGALVCALLMATYTDAATRQASVTAAQKLTRGLLFNPAITLLGIYPEEWKQGLRKILVQACSQQYSSQRSEETEVPADRQKDTRCGAYINWNIIQPF